VEGDGLDVLRANADRHDAVFFIDPPYTIAGRRLYLHSTIDHANLFEIASSLKGEFLITYDNSVEIAHLAKKAVLETCTVPMKNTHHSCKNGAVNRKGSEVGVRVILRHRNEL